MSPLVSVLVPVRDEAPFLSEALESLSEQTLEDFEAIVVDDGSTDESARIAEVHAAADRRFRVIRRQPKGLVAALERGREAASGTFLARMDGDDVALPDRLQHQVEAMAEGLDACGVQVEYFPRAAVRDGARRYEEWLNALVTVEEASRDVFIECPIAHPALLARSDAVAAAGGYRDRGWPEDYDLLLRIWTGGGRFRNVARVGLRWREHPDRHSRLDPAFTLDAFVRCKVHHLRRTLARDRDVVIWGAGPVGKQFARELARQGTEIAAFVDLDPRKIGKTIHRAPVVSVDDAPRYARSFAVGAVAGAAARGRIRAETARQGRQDGVDFVSVA